MSIPERRAMVERPAENLSVRRQCALLNLARSGVYRPGPVTGADDLALMRRIAHFADGERRFHAMVSRYFARS